MHSKPDSTDVQALVAIAARIPTTEGFLRAAGHFLTNSTLQVERLNEERAIAYADMASRNRGLAARARVRRYADHSTLKPIREGDDTWNVIAEVPSDLEPMMLDEAGKKRLGTRLAGEKPDLAESALGFVWAGDRITDPKTGELKPDAPQSLMVIHPFSRKATRLSGGLKTPASEIRILLPDTSYAGLIVPARGVEGLHGAVAGKP